MLTLILQSTTSVDFPSDSHCRLAMGSEGMNKYLFVSVCICFVARQNSQSNPRQALDPSSQEGIAAVLGKLLRAIQPRGDCPGSELCFKIPKCPPPPRFHQHNTSYRSGRTKRERWECPARPPTLSSNSFLKASAVLPLRRE